MSGTPEQLALLRYLCAHVSSGRQLAVRHADTRFGGGNKPKLPLPKPPPPNPLAHNRQPKVRFTVADDAPTVNSGGSSYQIPGGHLTTLLREMAVSYLFAILSVRLSSNSVCIAWRVHALWTACTCQRGLRALKTARTWLLTNVPVPSRWTRL